MRRIIGIVVIALLAGCGDVSSGPDVDEVQGALNPPVAGPVSPPLAFFGTMNSFPGFTTYNAPGGRSATRPQFGWPAWPSFVGLYSDPVNCCLAQLPTFTLPDNRLGFGEVMIWTRDYRWGTGGFSPQVGYPNGTPFYANAWSDDIPLRTLTPGYPQSAGFVFTESDMGASTFPQNKPGYLITYLIMDFYARVTICSQANFTGICYQYGYNCNLGSRAIGSVCHGDTAQERANSKSWTDISPMAATADNTGMPYAHMSLKVEYGF